MKKLTLTLSLISSLFLISCSSDDAPEPKRWLDLFFIWGDRYYKSDGEHYFSYDLAVNDTSTVWMGVGVMPTYINAEISDLHLSTSDNNIIKYTPIWKNPEGYVYHSLITANKIGTAFLYLEYKDLKDSIEINVIPK